MYSIKSFSIIGFLVVSLWGCVSTKVGFHYDEKSPIEALIGINNIQVTDAGLIRFESISYKHLNEYSAQYSNVGILQSIGQKTGRSKWVKSPNYDRHDIEVTWSSNPELNKAVRTIGPINIEDDLLKANADSVITVTCKTCTEVGMPTYIEGGVKIHREYTFIKTVGEYRADMLARKRQLEKDNREYAKRQDALRKEAEETSRRVKNEETQRLKRVAIDGDGSSDDLTCKKFGFKPQTNGYAECRLKLDMASRQAAQQQAQYDEQKRQYDARVAEIQKERDRQRAMKQLEMGLRMMSGQSIQDAAMATSGMPPIPKPPGPVNQTIIMPGGRMVNCTTTGSVTNCF